MGAKTGRWPAAVAVTAAGLFLGAGGFGLYRAANAEPVPAAPPQFRPAGGELLPGPVNDPAVSPALGIVPAAPPPVTARPGDVLPVPAIPAGPRADADAIPTRLSDLPKVPSVPPEVLPAPRLDGPPVPVAPLPAAPRPAAPQKPPIAKPAPDAVSPEILPLPIPVEVPQPAPPAKSPGSPPPPLPPPAGLNLQPSQPRLNVKPVEPVPAPPPTIEFPAAPTFELNKPGSGARATVPVAVPTARGSAAGPPPTGDAPMPMSFRLMTRAAVLGTALLATPALADDPKPDDPVKHADLKPLKDQLEGLRKDVKDLKEALEGKTDKGVTDDGLLKTVRSLQSTLNRLDSKLQSLENRLSDANRTAASSPLASGTTPPAFASKAVVKVVNEYPTEISMLVNGVPHRVAANSTQDVTVAAGTFKYQLLTSGGGEVTSTIKDGETVTLRVR